MIEGTPGGTLHIDSVLAADCGTTTTKAALMDMVNGQYRFIARGEVPNTVEPLQEDASLAVRCALSAIEDITGRTLIDEKEQLITPERVTGQGVDAFVVTASGASPLRMLLAGLSRDFSLASALRVAHSTYSHIEGIISLDIRAGGRQTPEEYVRLIHRTHPEVILITGGTDGGSATPVLSIVELVALGCSLLEETARPRVVYAGNAAIRSQVAEILGPVTELRTVDNVRPTLEVENLGPALQEINALYRALKLEQEPRFDNLVGWVTSGAVLPTAQALGYVVQYLARLYAQPKGVLGVDLGGSTTTVIAATQDTLIPTIRSDLGLGQAITRVLELIDIEDILRWLPFEMTPTEARNRILNKALHPTTVPETRTDLLLEQAVAREVLRLTLEEARASWPAGLPGLAPELCPFFEPILATGGVLAHAPRHGQAALVLLDAIQPVGVTTLVLDTNGLAASLGAVALVQPQMAAQVLDLGGFVTLGAVVAPVGQAREGEIVLRVKISYQSGGKLEVEVPFGSLEVLPLPLGQRAVLELHPLRGFDVGWGVRGRSVPIEVNGGTVGLIIDARGRPLALPSKREVRQAKVQQWMWDMGA